MLLDRRRRIALVGILVGLVAVGVIGTVVVDEVVRDDAATTTVAELDAAAAELLEALRAERGATYHAVYEGTTPDVPGVIRLETWQAPPSRREDTEVIVDGEPLVTSTIATPEGTVRCTRAGTDTWTCEPLGTGDDDDVEGGDALGDARLAEFEQRIRQGEVEVRDDTIDGRAVRCYTLTVAGEASERCTTPEGVPVLVRAGDSEVRLVTLDTDIPTTTFAPPASG